MSDSPRRPQRHPNRLNRPHAGQSLDPTLTRKGTLAHPGSLFVGFGALFFFAYVFNLAGLQTWLDGLFSGLDTQARSHNNQVSTFVVAALPYLGVAIGAFILIMVLMMLGRGAKSVKKRRKLGNRESVSLHEFADAAAAHGISKKVAREAYRELLPHYDNNMRVTLSDRMTTTLHMRPVEVSELYGNLLRHTDRQREVGDDAGKIDSVLDLLTCVEKSTVRSLTQSKLHLRQERAAAAPRKRASIGHRIKESLLRSVVRKAAPVETHAPAPVRDPAVVRDPSVIKPARLAVKELEMKPKAMPQKEEVGQQVATQ
jgi:hypothetical protein